jgi:hypothetical protein
MRKVVQFLPYVSRSLAICAVLAGLGVGLLEVYLSPLVCFDSCPDRDFYFSYLGPAAVRLMTPCIVLAVLALAVQATFPSASGSDCCALLPDQLRAWDGLWGWALTLVAGAWSGVLAYLQWRRSATPVSS